MESRIKQVQCGLFFFVMACVVRFWWMVHSGDWGQPLQHWMMEEVAIAQHIAADRGFLSPYVEYEAAKPPVYSALSAPAYPYMLAGLLRIFGTGGELAAYRASMLINGLVGAAAVGLLAGLAMTRFGFLAAAFSGLLGSFLPPLVYRSATLWDTPFVMASIVIVLFVAGARKMPESLMGNILWGAVLGLAGLFNPVTLPLAFAGIIVMGVKDVTVFAGIRRMIIIGLASVAVLLPWTIRNYELFGCLVPIRNCMGRELWIGQQPGCDGTSGSVGAALLSSTKPEGQLLQELGEDAYFRMRLKDAVAMIKQDVPCFILKTMHRITLFWIGDLRESPFGGSMNSFLVAAKAVSLVLLLILALMGIRSDPDKYMQWLALFVFFVLPLPYYVTHVCPQYRVPVLLLEAYWGGAGLRYLVQVVRRKEMKMA